MTLKINDIKKTYDREVLKNISHSFESGKLYVIKGVSGCGKSTLLNIIGGVESDFTGEIILDGENLEKNSNTRLSKSGYIYQQSLLLSGITIRENLLLIRNDAVRIEGLCGELGLTSLLEKTPAELSGGERQRVAIVRALLNSPQILLADEPTASLDDGNSQKIAEMIADLRADDRIIIVATHEQCFDELADEIIYLKYGDIDGVQSFSHMHENKAQNKYKVENKLKPINSIKYNLKRGKNNLRFSAVFPYAFILLIILLVSTVQNCFYSEYFSFIKDKYPIDAFNIDRVRYEASDSPYKNDIFVYEPYTAVDSDVTAYYLPAKEHSVLAIDGMLQYGSFPDEEDEIIVSIDYAINKLGTGNCVGDKTVFCGREFTVSGIMYKFDRSSGFEQDSRNENFYSYINSDTYYYNNFKQTNGMFVFIPYNTLKEIGNPVDNAEKIRCVYKDLFEDDMAYTAIRDMAIGPDNPNGSSILSTFAINTFEYNIRDTILAIDIITIIIYGILIICFIIACIFVSTQVQIELFYRRKELGFLQIFGLKKKRVKRLVMTGYILKMAYAVLLSILLYGICVIAYLFITGRLICFNLIHAPIIILFIVTFYLISVRKSISKFLKQSIVKLIT